MDVTEIIPILFIFMVGVLLMAVIFGNVSTSLTETGVVENDTFERVDDMAAQSFNILGGVGPIAIVVVGFLIVIGWWKFG
jgi:hypothetical protein